MTITNTSHGRGLCSGGGSESSSGGNHDGGGESTVEMDSSCLRVLVVDDDPTCLMILERMLTTCLYEVTKCNRAEIALSILRKNKNGFDIVISDVHMPGMDGFKLLELISLEMDLPVIMMSADDSKSVVLKGVEHGAVDYLIKPVRMEALKTIWQHVVRKKKETIPTRGRGWDDDDDDDDDDNSCLVNEGNNWNRKKRRFVWDDELHQKFLAAVNQLGGFEKAVPKKIFELMNVPGLTRKHVASHLQKCRTYLRRLGGVSQSQHQGNIDNSFVMGQDASFDPLSALNEFDLQELAGSPGQLPAQSFSQIQDAGLGLPTMVSESDFPVSSIADERSIFSFDNPTARFRDGYHGQQPQQRMMMMPLPDQEPMQPMLSNGIPEKSCYSGRNSIPESSRVFPTCYTNAEPQNTSDSMYFNNFTRELPVNSFPLASTPGQNEHCAYQEDVNCSEAGFTPPSFDMFSNTHNDWDLQSLGIAFDAHQDAETVPCTSSGAVPCTSSGAYPSLAVAATEHDQSQQQTQMMPPRMVPHLDGSSVGAKPERGGIVDAVVNAFQEQSSDQKDILRKFGL